MVLIDFWTLSSLGLGLSLVFGWLDCFSPGFRGSRGSRLASGLFLWSMMLRSGLSVTQASAGLPVDADVSSRFWFC